MLASRRAGADAAELVNRRIGANRLLKADTIDLASRIVGAAAVHGGLALITI